MSSKRDVVTVHPSRGLNAQVMVQENERITQIIPLNAEQTRAFLRWLATQP